MYDQAHAGFQGRGFCTKQRNFRQHCLTGRSWSEKKVTRRVNMVTQLAIIYSV